MPRADDGDAPANDVAATAAAVDSSLATPFTRQVGIEVPLVCGAMYPCSNPELVAAVSAAGGIGVVQPISMVYVFGHDFRAGLRMIRSLTDKPIGMNALVEKTADKVDLPALGGHDQVPRRHGCFRGRHRRGGGGSGNSLTGTPSVFIRPIKG